MKTTSVRMALVAMAAGLCGGCGAVDLLLYPSAQQKIMHNHMTQLTPAEIKAWRQAIIQAQGPGGGPGFTDGQATAIAAFLHDNGIDAPSQLSAWELPSPFADLDPLASAFGLAPSRPVATILRETIELPLFGFDFALG